jgi:hypothetical protein
MKTPRLYADPDCWAFQLQFPDEFASYGCGPGGVGDYLVPDTIHGLRVQNACRIHDWGYRHADAASEDDRKRHDVIFRFNLIRIVDFYTTSKLMKRLRYRRVKTYYDMVRIFGGPAYWEERNTDVLMRTMDF